MKPSFLNIARRRLFVFAFAALVALGAAYTPVLLDSMTNTALTPTAFACGPVSGGC